MGLFDSLKKSIENVAKEVDLHKDDLTKELEKFADQAKNTVNNAVGNNNTSLPQQKSAPVYQAVPVMKREVADQFAKFDDIISRNFADCEVIRNLPARELAPSCHPACTPVQFMFYTNGVPSLAVVLVKENTYRGMNVIGTKKICEDLNIRYIRFYHEYENAEDYVVNRIRENL